MSNTLRELLADNRELILARFVEEVRAEQLPPDRVSRALLEDHLPSFLDELIADLEPNESAAARRHGGQRLALGYEIEALVREYGVLRRVILDVARRAGAAPRLDELDLLMRRIDVGVAQATAEYARHRDQLLNAERARLDFLARAGELLASSLDHRATLAGLTELLVPSLADWCAVHLEGGSVDDMPIAHVDPAKAAIVREIYRRYPLPSDSPNGYQAVVRTNRPSLMRRVDPGLFEVAAQSPEHLQMLRTLGASSWMILPLRAQNTTFGALTLVYAESGRHYDDDDVLFADELARRAALAIHNAKLFDHSQKALARAESDRRTRDEFLAMVSHELRTPLNAILGWTRLLSAGKVGIDEQSRALQVIERNALRQTRLVVDLLELSAAATGTARVRLTQLDFAAVVARALQGVRSAAEAKGIAIEAELGAVSVRGDEARLQQMVWQLLSNAVKFSPRQSRVSVSLIADGGDVELVVRDEGIGIEADFLPFVFDSFRQYDASTTRLQGGLGIGLSIAKHVVELHGGTIAAHSDGAARGATFVVRLPVSAPQAPLAVHRLPTDGEGIKVLVVDDDQEARELIAAVLGDRGMAVRTAEDAGAALSLLETEAPDALLSDLMMPVVDGLSFIRAVRSSTSAYRDVPAIALTVLATSEDRARAIDAGFNRHLAKPVKPEVLVSAVHEAVSLRRAAGSGIHPRGAR